MKDCGPDWKKNGSKPSCAGGRQDFQSKDPRCGEMQKRSISLDPGSFMSGCRYDGYWTAPAAPSPMPVRAFPVLTEGSCVLSSAGTWAPDVSDGAWAVVSAGVWAALVSAGVSAELEGVCPAAAGSVGVCAVSEPAAALTSWEGRRAGSAAPVLSVPVPPGTAATPPSEALWLSE